jgi:hypothetical protein
MNNDPKVPKDFILTELQSKVGAHDERTASPKAALSRTAMAGVLMAAAIGALAVTTLAHSDQKATANAVVATTPAPSAASAPVRPFTFGHLEFEYLSGGVPGLVAPPSSQAQ